MGNQQDIRKLLRGKFQDFEPEPDRDIWAGIQQAVRPVPFYKKMGWYGYAAAAVVLLLLAIGIGITDILYRQPGLPVRSVAAGDLAPTGQEQAPDNKEQEGAYTARREGETHPLESQGRPVQATRPVLQTQNVRPNPVATGSTAHTEAIDTPSPEKAQAPVLAITPPAGNLPAIHAEVTAQEIGNIPVPGVRTVANVTPTGDRRRIDLDGLSLDDALYIAGNGLKNLASKPEKVLTSEDGTETIKTYRINFLDISFSKKTHIIKSSTKKET